MVIYELHVGTFTEAGTFAAAIERLEYLRQLGVTALQLMPVNDFRGERGWGYDGVLPYAPESSYGRPEDLKALIDAAHRHEICLFLDVVYNHFGPDGSYIPACAPLFSDKHGSPWGDGVNYDDEGSGEVRRFVVENVAHWINEFRVDRLRFDAVHAIKDDSDQHLLGLIASTAREAAGDRHFHLIVEDEANSSDLLERDENGHPKLYTAQWNDDIITSSTRQRQGRISATMPTMRTMPARSLGLYLKDSSSRARRCHTVGLVVVSPAGIFPRQPSSRSFKTSTKWVTVRSATACRPALHSRRSRLWPAVTFWRPRPHDLPGRGMECAHAVSYFCDSDEELNENVRKGRREELSRLPGFDDEAAKSTPDPPSVETFIRAKLNWSEPAQANNAAMLDTYRELISLRHTEIVPRLDACQTQYARTSGKIVEVCWSLGNDRRLRLVANLSSEVQMQQGVPIGRSIWSNGLGRHSSDGAVVGRLDDRLRGRRILGVSLQAPRASSTDAVRNPSAKTSPHRSASRRNAVDFSDFIVGTWANPAS